MIVRDAADFITETLQSVLPYIDEWVIVDTGSLDNTKQVVQNFFDEVRLKGHLVEQPWIGFAHNRTEAIALCQGHGDYALMIDADDFIVGDLPVKTFDDSLDGYVVNIKRGEFQWLRAQIYNRAKKKNFIRISNNYFYFIFI